MKNMFVRFVREEEGQDLIEYAMIVTLVALVGGATAGALGTNLAAWYTAMAGRIPTWTTAAGS